MDYEADRRQVKASRVTSKQSLWQSSPSKSRPERGCKLKIGEKKKTVKKCAEETKRNKSLKTKRKAAGRVSMFFVDISFLGYERGEGLLLQPHESFTLTPVWSERD